MQLSNMTMEQENYHVIIVLSKIIQSQWFIPLEVDSKNFNVNSNKASLSTNCDRHVIANNSSLTYKHQF